MPQNSTSRPRPSRFHADRVAGVIRSSAFWSAMLAAINAAREAAGEVVLEQSRQIGIGMHITERLWGVSPVKPMFRGAPFNRTGMVQLFPISSRKKNTQRRTVSTSDIGRHRMGKSDLFRSDHHDISV